MKKLIFLTLIVSLALVFVSCQGDTSTQTEVTTGNKETVAETVTTAETITTAEATSDKETVVETSTTAEATSDEETVAETVTTAEVSNSEETAVETVTTEESTETNQITGETTEHNTQETKKYQVLESGMSDSAVPGAHHTNDINIYINTYIRLPEGTEKEAIVNGKKIELTYYDSLEGSYYNDNYDSYHKMDDYSLTVININQKTGNVDFYLNSIRNYMDIVDVNNKKSEDECKSIAIKYFEKYSNNDEYEIVRISSSRLGKFSVFNFYFSRVINGVETMDGGCVTVTEYGDVYSHDFDALGEMKDVEVPDADELEIIDNSVDEKIKEIYKNISNEYTVSYEIYSRTLVRFDDGRYAMRYLLDVNIESIDPELISWSEGPMFFVYL